MALTGKIRKAVRATRSLNVLLALCFLAAQLVPTAFAAAASFSDTDYIVVCTADGFKKVPLSELGLESLAQDDAGTDIPSQQDCDVCLLICAKGVSDAAPHVAVVRLPYQPLHHIVRDDRPTVHASTGFNQNTPSRAPPSFV